MSSKKGTLYLLLKDKYGRDDAKKLEKLISKRQKLIRSKANKEDIKDVSRKIEEIKDKNKGVNNIENMERGPLDV